MKGLPTRRKNPGKNIPGYIRFHSDKVGKGREEKWAEGGEGERMAWGRDLR